MAPFFLIFYHFFFKSGMCDCGMNDAQRGEVHRLNWIELDWIGGGFARGMWDRWVGKVG